MSRLQINFKKCPPPVSQIVMDGDLFVYTIGFAVEEAIEWPLADGGFTAEILGDLPLAKRLLDNRLRHFKGTVPDGVTFTLAITGDSPNWRRGVDPSYKANRGRKPKDYQGIRAHLRSKPFTVESRDGLEADDWMAQEGSGCPETALASMDKDFFTVPCLFLHMSQRERARAYRISPIQAICFLFFQALAGDPVDGYKGVKHVGKAKTKQLLQLCELKALTIGEAYLLLKRACRLREKQFRTARSASGDYPALNLWRQFTTCLDLASLTWAGEDPGVGIGLRRIFKHRHEKMEYFLPYFDDAETARHTICKL